MSSSSADLYRVLHVTECFGAGTQRAIENIVNEMPELEHHLLYRPEEEPRFPEQFASMTLLPSGHVKRIRAVRSAVDRLRPNAVHLHSSWAGMYGRARSLPSRVIYQPHCYAFENPNWSGVQRGIFYAAERALGRHTDVVVAVSERERMLGHRLAPTAFVELVANRSTVEYVGQRPELDLRQSVVMCGRINHQKDPEWFAQVAERAGGQLKFVWIGDGEEPLRRRLVDAGVRVTGWLSTAKVQAELDAAFAYLHSAAYEGLPISILDAASRMVPILVRESPAFEGLGLTVASSPDQAASQLDELTSDGAVAAANLKIFRSVFDPAQIRPSLERVYE